MPCAGRVITPPHAILADIGARLLNKLRSQQICDVVLESRIQLSDEYFTDRADSLVAIRTSETPVSSIFYVSTRALIALSRLPLRLERNSRWSF